MLFGEMDRSAKIVLGLVVVLSAASGVGYWHWVSSRDEAAFVRDDSGALSNDDTSLRSAYAFLRKGGYKVALQTPEDARPPKIENAWWIFQSNSEWLGKPEQRAAEVKRFAEQGGTVVIAPAEALTAPPEDDSDEPTAVQKESDRFFKALGLDVQLLAFDDSQDEEEDGDGEPPPDETSGYTLPVVGHGAHFSNLEYVQTAWGNFWSGEDLLKGEVRLDSDGFPLVVEFEMGRGRVVLVAESTYFENEFLGDEHNTALLRALASAYGAQGISLYAAR